MSGSDPTGLAVVKLGGNLLKDATYRADIARQVVALSAAGLRMLVVHGGGSAISARLNQAGIVPRFIQGMRVTDEASMAIVEEVLEDINRRMLAAIEAAGGVAAGLIGSQGLLISTPMRIDGEDLGRVGEVERLDNSLLLEPLAAGRIVVIAPTGNDSVNGLSYNINADVAACALASGIAADHLLLLADVDGVLDAQQRPLSRLTRTRAEQLIAEGTIRRGMVPKVRQALQAVDRGVGTVHILNGQRPDALYNQLLGGTEAGTRITA